MDKRDALSVLKAETEIAGGVSASDFYPAFVSFLIGLIFFSFSTALIVGGITLIVFQSIKKKLGDSEKVYEFFTYLARPKKYKRRF
jgi:hypothetical protein